MRLNNGKIIIQTVDFFTPIVDDPYNFGQIAAANSLSDIYAMGAIPSFALNIVGFPIEELSKEILVEILRGGADKAKEAGIPIVGGHSINDNEPKYGLVVTGESDESLLIKNSSAKLNDALVLTKPLGTGIISTAIKKGLAKSSEIKEVTECMKALNAFPAKIMSKFEVSAATDITGFGLIGHLIEMCDASNVSAEIYVDEVHFIKGVHALIKKRIIPSGTKRNLDYFSKKIIFSELISKDKRILMADAQTSGGLLVSLPADNAEEYIKACNERGDIKAKIIGKITPSRNKKVLFK